LSLGLGIGATTAIFSAVNATLLRPLPFEDPARLMRVSLLLPRSVGLNPDGTRREMVWSYPKYQLFRDSQQIFDSVSTYLRTQYNLTNVDQPERLWGEVVGTSYFSVLGIDAELGRGFVSGDVTPEADHEAVLSHGLWLRKFAGDPEILGSTIHLDGDPHTVVGVMPQGFGGLRGAPELWVPTSTLGPSISESRSHQYHVVARLKPGLTYEQAIDAMGILGAQVDEAFPDAEPWSATARPLNQYRVSDTLRTSVLLLFGAAGIVLLVACMNVAGLVMSRCTARQREIATRLALGASRSRLARQLFAESLTLAALGGVMGIAFAQVGVECFNSLGAATRFQMSGLERTGFSSIDVDATTLLFCLAATTVASILVGLFPAFRGSRLSLVEAIKGSAASGKLRRAVAREVLVVTQVALAFMLLSGAGLLIRTLGQMNAIDLGFQPAGVLTVRVALPTSRYDRLAGQAFFDDLLERTQALPGVGGATFVDCAPFADACRNTSSAYPGGDVDIESSEGLIVGVSFVSPGYFDVLGVPLLAGRAFATSDRTGTPRVVVIGRATAALLWPGEDAVGKTLSLRGFDGATVVGVVDDVRYENIEEAPRPNVYISASQSARQEGFLLVRTMVDPASLVSAIRQTLREMDSNLPLFDVRMMRERVEAETWRTRFSTLMISLFASVTLLLSAVGIYGVLSYSVDRRSHDIGVSKALGATQTSVLKGVVGRALLTVIVGIALGIAAALAGARLLAALLYETSPYDPLTYGAVALVFITVALAAGYFPARRASSVNPVDALRAE
jgi:predicted permease